jgi:hypothetical protein
LPSIKCEQCGLVNFGAATQCERCHTSLAQNVLFTSDSNRQGIVLEDGYVLPPPPSIGVSSGVWRNDSKLVMSKDALLPDRCVKCNAYTTGRIKRKFSWHHPAIYLLILFAWLIYLIVSMVVRKRATVDLGICDEHRAKRRTYIWLTWALLLLGVAGFFVAIMVDDGTPAALGFLVLLSGIIFGVISTRVAYPTKIDDRFVWLKGVNKDYLDLLPQWPGL